MRELREFYVVELPNPIPGATGHPQESELGLRSVQRRGTQTYASDLIVEANSLEEAVEVARGCFGPRATLYAAPVGRRFPGVGA
jgi:hypothetical protein